ncbi:ATP-binding cassette sub-family C member 9-like [Lytechinus pictus]|uniref:ATP-binding cassette sub-family C member 9-like n=1 Tax=Lytechinus pictus TaxID=7653 RepID=UPI0030B9D33D
MASAAWGWFCGSNASDSSFDFNSTVNRECLVDAIISVPPVSFSVLAILTTIITRCCCIRGNATLYLLRYPGHSLRWILSLALIAVCLAAIGEGILTEESFRKGGDHPHPYLYLNGVFLLLSAIISLSYYQFLEKRRIKHLSWLLLLFWSVSIVTMSYRLHHFLNDDLIAGSGTNKLDIFRYDVTILFLVIYSILFFVEFNFIIKTICCFEASVDSLPADVKKEKMKYLSKYSNLLSEVTYWWENWIFKTGYKKVVEVDDLGNIPEVHTSMYNHSRFKNVFEREKEKCFLQGKELNIFKVLCITYGPTIAFAGLLKIIGDLLAFIGPLAISGIVNFVTKTYYLPEDAQRELVSPHLVSPAEFFANGYVLVGAVFLSSLLRHTCDQYYQYMVSMEGLHVRSAIQSMVYWKSMRMSTYAISGGMMTMGQITNHMSVDANNVMMFFQLSNEIWAVPLKIIITLVLLYRQLGYPALIASSLFFLTFPIQIKIGVTVAGIIKQFLQCADKRLKLSNEMLNGIKLLKIYGWEKLFYGLIQKAREKELAQILKMYFVISCNFVLNSGVPGIVTLIAFGTYTSLTGKPLTPDVAFTTLSLFNQITAPLFLLPFVINLFVNCLVSCRRLKTYFLAPEIEGGVNDDDEKDFESTIMNRNGRGFNTHNGSYQHGTEVKIREPKIKKKTFTVDDDDGLPDSDRAPLLASNTSYGSVESFRGNMDTSFCEDLPSDVAIRVIDGNFTWDPSASTPILQDINLDIPAGKLTIIVGTVGSGKSSLLQAIMGEMTTLSGTVQVNRTHEDIALAAQKAWLVNSSLKENILFGEKLKDSKYRKVIDACALKPDIDMLPAGDQTEIGEKGINLSGGQKQRVSVARALYSGRNIVILDDPLSALDVHVGAHLFQHGISKILRKHYQTVILVTHQLQYLPEADQIIVMKDGRIITMGSPEEVAILDPTLFSEWNRAIQIFSESEVESGAESEGLVDERKALRRLVARSVSPSGISAECPEENEKGRLIAKEEKEKGSVSYRMYLHYFKAMGYWLTIFVLLTVVIRSALQISTNFWLSSWAQYDLNITGNSVDKTSYWIGGYAGLSMSTLVVSSISIFAIAFGALHAARNLHYALIDNIIHIPMRFFDTTPIGRVLNRFSSDTQLIDQRLVHTLRLLINLAATVFSSLVVQVVVVWYFVFFFIPISVIFIMLVIYYITTSRELQRAESVSRSPVFAHFSETLGGLSTIRAYKDEKRFFQIIMDHINTNNTVFLYLLTSMRWVAIRLDFLGDFVVFSASLCVLLGAAYLGIDSSLVGLAISYALEVSLYMNFMVRQCSDLELQMNAVERVRFYSEVPTEDYNGLEPPPDWPSRGEIQFEDISVRYSHDLDPVLHDVSLDIFSQEKLGICGRTGSGKSSLTLALFRMIDTFKGRILIDGIDIASVPLRTLRQRLSIIPQDAILFTGTIRYNLDPIGTKTDKELWEALDVAQLKEVVSNIDAGLDYQVTEGGENFSVGQRQLFCLARAFLRHSKIIVMDEATASIDQETDSILQDVVADIFKDRTVLTIAHRVATIINSDKILTLSDGYVAENDTPDELLQRENSIFASLVKAGK